MDNQFALVTSGSAVNIDHKHDWAIVWVSDDLEAFECVTCGIQQIDPPED